MVDIIDDTQTISIGIIIEGNLEITNVAYPLQVHSEEPFDIDYTVHNTTEDDTFWGGLYDTSGALIPGTDWVEWINAGGNLPRIINFPIGITEPFSGTLKVGHVE